MKVTVEGVDAPLLEGLHGKVSGEGEVGTRHHVGGLNAVDAAIRPVQLCLRDGRGGLERRRRSIGEQAVGAETLHGHRGRGQRHRHGAGDTGAEQHGAIRRGDADGIRVGRRCGMAFVWVVCWSSTGSLVAASRCYVDALEVGADASRARGLPIALEMLAPLYDRTRTCD